MKIPFATALLAVVLASSLRVVDAKAVHLFHSPATADQAVDKYYRTELYFGRSIPGGGMVSDEQWDQFLAEVVTLRFPDGFTILKGTGQYREKGGKIISEPSQILVFFYSTKTKGKAAKIEEIRRLM
jgi:hypothetical protein